MDTKYITDLTNNEAKQFFLQDNSYHNFELPEYFNFSMLLKTIDNKLGECDNLKKILNNGCKPWEYEGNNYILRNNKDGKFSRRQLELIHPVIYVALVSLITIKENWKLLIEVYNDLNAVNKNIVESFSMPIVPENLDYKKELQVENRLENIEKKSISLSLDYNFLFNTDIVDCYGSIYTHSISRVIHGREWSKSHKDFEDGLGNKIDKYIQYMHYGQTNGLPQGSVLMDFIAEYVLLYIDNKLTEKLTQELGDYDPENERFKILRYRDDYRIFVNDSKDGEKIIKTLSEVLGDMGMKINADKTGGSGNVIYNSIKKDKLDYMINYTNYIKIFDKDKKDEQDKICEIDIIKDLIIIDNFGDKHPCSGTLLKLLEYISNKIKTIDIISEEGILQIIAILTDIAYKNPRVYPIISWTLCETLAFVKNDRTKLQIIKKIINKFNDRPNTEILNLWLQRITYLIDKEWQYQGKLYTLLFSEKNHIWNNERLTDDYKGIVENIPVVDNMKLSGLTSHFSEDEINNITLWHHYN